MKDYRTWWRLNTEIMEGIWYSDNIVCGDEFFSDCEVDCITEQLWAIREGLAEKPK